MDKDKEPDKEPEKGTEDLKATLIEEAISLGLKIPRLSIGGIKNTKPENIAKEKARQNKQLIYSLKTMIAKHIANAKMKPIERRKALLVSRLKAVKARDRASTYSDVIVKAWLEELEMISSNPKAWNKTTTNGTKPYTPSSKKKKSALDILDEMDLE